MYCVHCGKEVEPDALYCPYCGGRLYDSEQSNEETAEEPLDSWNLKHSFQQATGKINQMVGETGHVDIDVKDAFSDVFKRHTKAEAEHLFIAGTAATTPLEKDISDEWPKPWLFSRVFIIMALTYGLLYIATAFFANVLAIPGLIGIGSFAVPFSLLIFFFETNAPRNISIYEIAKMFFVGGAASLVATLFLYSIFPVDQLDFTGAIIVGIVEEAGKLAIIAYFTRQLNPKFILNGLLIGAAIGAGFAGFESAGYAYTTGMYDPDRMLSVIFTRGWTAIGTHIVWSAIAGAALVYVKKHRRLTSDHVLSGSFLQLFIVSVILHAVWDMPIMGEFYYIKHIILIGIAWTFILVLMSAGLKQIVKLHEPKLTDHTTNQTDP